MPAAADACLIRYRDARPCAADAQTLAQIGARTFVETFGASYRPADLEAFLRDNHSPPAAARYLSTPEVAVRLVEDAQGCAGYAMLAVNGLPHVPAGARVIELKRFYLLERLHGRGVADALMAWVLERARSGGHDLVTLSVFAENNRAKRFYARHGFAEVGRYVFMVGDQADDERVWLKPLA